MTMTTIELPDDLYHSAVALAQATGRTTSDLMAEALQHYIAQADGLDDDESDDVTHEDLMATWIERGLLRQADLDAPDPVSLEEYQLAQQC